jgi:hypothetical protein
LIRNLLFGIEPDDAATFALAGAFLVVLSVVARSAGPACRPR